MNSANSIKVGNNFLPKSINSFVANTVNSVSNTLNNSMKNTGNAMKQISVPVAQSIGSVPMDRSSNMLFIMIGLFAVIIFLAIFFSKQISEAVSDLWANVRKMLGYTSQEAVTISKDAGKELGQAITDIENVFTGGSESDTVNKFLPGKKQVFNISENHYIYGDAEPLCRALGAEVATYEQVKQAWEQGADWCNYGWIKGQGAVYPTQQTSWDKLQTGTDDERLQCGMPGVNGGYFDNPNLRFGVNCFGPKPSETDNDIKNLLEGNNKVMTPEAVAEKKKELKYRSERNEIAVLPFRDSAWSS